MINCAADVRPGTGDDPVAESVRMTAGRSFERHGRTIEKTGAVSRTFSRSAYRSYSSPDQPLPPFDSADETVSAPDLGQVGRRRQGKMTAGEAKQRTEPTPHPAGRHAAPCGVDFGRGDGVRSGRLCHCGRPPSGSRANNRWFRRLRGARSAARSADRRCASWSRGSTRDRCRPRARERAEARRDPTLP